MTDRWARDAAVAGDPAAWRALVEGAVAPVAGYVRWRAGGWTDLADEVTQDTWLTAARRLKAFDPDQGSFAGWVCGIAANVFRSHLRQRKLLPLPADLPAPATPTDRSARVAAALAELPPHYEQVLRAKYLDGRSVDAIAAESGESAKAVESRLTRAREAFRAAYGEPGDDG
jgi:RNA polymerase sigma-70 factor, ECF subfamily